MKFLWGHDSVHNREIGIGLVKGTGFLLEVLKNVCKLTVVMVLHICECIILKTTELYFFHR